MESVGGCSVIRPADIEGILTFAAEETGGAYSLLVGEGPAGAPGPALHEHPSTDEAFYVAAGQATFRLGDEEISASAGSLVFVPRGTPHTVWNAGTDVLRGVIIISPGDVEHVFVEVAS